MGSGFFECGFCLIWFSLVYFGLLFLSFVFAFLFDWGFGVADFFGLGWKEKTSTEHQAGTIVTGYLG